MMLKAISLILVSACILGFLAFPCHAQEDQRPASDLLQEVDRFEAEQRKMLLSEGKRYDRDAQDDAAKRKKALAKKHAADLSARTDLEAKDHYYLGRLYAAAENDPKVLEAMQNFLKQIPETAKGEMVQSANGYLIRLASTVVPDDRR